MRSRLSTLFHAILIALPTTIACGGETDDSAGTTGGQSGQGGSSVAGQGGAGSAGASGSSTQGGAGGGVAGSGGTVAAGAGGSEVAGAGGAGNAAGSAGAGNAAGTGAGNAAGTGAGNAAGTGGSAGAGAAGQGGAAGAGAAGQGQGGAGGASAGFEALTCFPAGIAAELGFDSIEVFRGQVDLSQTATLQGEWASVFQDGKPCDKVVEQYACFGKIEETKTSTTTSQLQAGYESGGGPPTVERDLIVVTVGDNIRTAASLDELTKLLQPLDNLAKITLWMRYRFQNDCQLEAREVDGGFEVWVRDLLVNDCPFTNEDQLYKVTPTGEITLLEKANTVQSGACAGRRPAGLLPASSGAATPLAAYFGRMAYLEAASVEAFSRLHDELLAQGAPSDLLAACLESAADEVRHATLMGDLAERFGACSEEPSIAPARPRSLLELAIENAVEGCVRETYGALEASFQASHADDEQVRAALVSIARDETAHAELSWRLHAWLEDRVPEAEWRLVERAMERAIHELRGELRVPRGHSLVAVAGLPDEDTAQELLDGLQRQLWTDALPAAA